MTATTSTSIDFPTLSEIAQARAFYDALRVAYTLADEHLSAVCVEVGDDRLNERTMRLLCPPYRAAAEAQDRVVRHLADLERTWGRKVLGVEDQPYFAIELIP
jgi:hypothetical protein